MFALQLSQVLESPWPGATRPLSSLLAPPRQSIAGDPPPRQLPEEIWHLAHVFIPAQVLVSFLYLRVWLKAAEAERDLSVEFKKLWIMLFFL